MSVTAQDLFASVQAAHGKAACEADWRGVCSRAYYAIYDDCKSLHVGFSTPGRLTPESGGGMHADLIDQLLHPTLPRTSPDFFKSIAIGHMMKSMYASRIKADYKRDSAVEKPTADMSIKFAQEILEKLFPSKSEEKLQPSATGGRPTLTRIK